MALTRWSGTASRWWMLAVCGGSWVLLLTQLSHLSLWIDEWFTVKDVSPTWANFIPELIATERRPPLYWALLKLWMSVAGDSEWVMRWFSAACVVVTMAGAFQLTKTLTRNNRLAFLSAAFMAAAPFTILYGRMMRSYWLFTLLVVLATYELWRLLSRPTRWRWLGYTLCATALFYTDYGAVAVLGTHGLWMIWQAWRLRSWRALLIPLSALGMAALFFIPWVGVLVAQSLRSTTSLIAADLATSPVGLTLKLAMPFVSFSIGETLYPWSPLGVIGVLLITALAAHGAWVLWKTQPLTAIFLLGWLGLSVLFTATLFSLVATDITFLNMASRTPHLIVVYSILIAQGWLSLPQRALRRVAGVGLGVVFAVSLGNYYQGLEFFNPIYTTPSREVAATLRATATADDLIIAEPDTLIGYYYQQHPGAAAYQDSDLPSNPALVENLRPKKIWIGVFGRDRSANEFDTAHFISWLAEQGYVETQRTGYAPVGESYRWVKARLLNREPYTHKLTLIEFSRQTEP